MRSSGRALAGRVPPGRTRLPARPKRRGIDFKMAWQDVPATRSSLVSPDRNGAMVVADCRVILHRRTTYAGLVMKRVRLDETRVMLTIVTVGVMLIALTASRNEPRQ